MTSHQLCYILLVRSKALFSVHTQGEGVTQGLNTMGWDHWNYLRGCLAHLHKTPGLLASDPVFFSLTEVAI